MPESKYATLTKTRKDLSLLTQLYDLYAQVLETAEEWNNVSWAEFGTQKDTMLEKVDGYDSRCELKERAKRESEESEAKRSEAKRAKLICYTGTLLYQSKYL